LLTGGWSGGWSAGNKYLSGISPTSAGTSGKLTGTRATLAQLVNVTTWQTMIGMGRHRGPHRPAGQPGNRRQNAARIAPDRSCGVIPLGNILPCLGNVPNAPESVVTIGRISLFRISETQRPDLRGS
jgi:hypothetical protein